MASPRIEREPITGPPSGVTHGADMGGSRRGAQEGRGCALQISGRQKLSDRFGFVSLAS